MDTLCVLTHLVLVCVPAMRRMVEPALSVDVLKASETVEHGMRLPHPLSLLSPLVVT